ncbi:MAG: hypothetical protein HPY52_10575 [Firmicutes bacterium]|nr:hypothetical protein [Bacillota bacterium]
MDKLELEYIRQRIIQLGIADKMTALDLIDLLLDQSFHSIIAKIKHPYPALMAEEVGDDVANVGIA